MADRLLCPLKKSITRPIVSEGVVVGICFISRKSWGPEPTAQTNLVPPASIPPYKAHIVLTHSLERTGERKES